MRGRLALVLLPPVLCATLGGAGEGGDNPRREVSGLEGAPVAAGQWENPFAGDVRAAQAGQKLFRRHCADCHGLDGSGRGNAPPLVSDRIRKAPAGDLFWFLTNGDLGAGMPAWSRLPDARRWQLVSFLKTLPAGADAPPPP